MGATDPQPGTTRAHPPACKAPEHGVRRGWLFRVPVIHSTFQIQHTRRPGEAGSAWQAPVQRSNLGKGCCSPIQRGMHMLKNARLRHL